MTQYPVKLYINDKNWIVAVFADGHDIVLGDCKTSVGAKRRLTVHAKYYGFTVNGTIAMPAEAFDSSDRAAS